ncbi:MAG: hypothetical protein PHY16_12300 [Methylobacter sp.]|nr:hypothetical protein [Methylobacter sp.]
MAKCKQQNFIKGTAKHSRTEGDYMSTLLDTMTLEDWQDVVSNALAAAKQGDAQAGRGWRSILSASLPVKPQRH